MNIEQIQKSLLRQVNQKETMSQRTKLVSWLVEHYGFSIANAEEHVDFYFEELKGCTTLK